MLFYADTKLLKSHPTPLIVLVFHLLLTHFCRGQSQLIGSSQPIVATLGHDIILPCHLDPAEDASGLTLEWTRADLNPRFVHVWRDGQELESKKHPSFEGRTSLFINELKLGNISLKLSKVKAGDQGTYRCFIPSPGKQSSVQLVVGSDAVTLPVVTLAGIDKDTSGVVLQCDSNSWYPEPEVVWLDGEGNLLSAGPTETVRGPDDLYTVSSRVTVEKRHSNNFTCRVQQKDIHQTRETHIYVPGDFFEVHFSSAVPIIVGLAVSLAACIVFILFLVFFGWRQNVKIKKSHSNKTDKGEKKNKSKSNDAENMFVTEEEREREMLMTTETETKNQSEEGHKKKLETNMELHEENQGREETVNKEESQNEKKEVENNQLEGNQTAAQSSWFFWSFWKPRKQHQDEQQKAEKEVESSNEEVKLKESELEQLRGEKQKMEKELKTLKEDLENRQKEVKTLNNQLESKNKEVQKLSEEKQRSENELKSHITQLDQKLWHEQRRAERAEKDLEAQTIRITEWEKEFKEEKKKREEAEKKVENSNKEPETKYIANRCEVLEENDTSSTNQSSITAPDVEVDPQGKYIRLRNSSNEEQQLEGWRLEVRLDETKPFMYTFENSFKLQAGNTVTLWASGSGGRHDATDRVWSDLKSWRSGDKLQVTLISNTGDIHYNLKFMS